VYQVAKHGPVSSNKIYLGLIKPEEDNFKIGNRSLTHRGLEQTYQRGIDVMNRYHKLLSQINISDIKVRASNDTSTLLSAYSQLVGMLGSKN
jgi:hypothetical protein